MDLNDYFKIQNSVVEANCAEFAEEYSWLNRAIELLLDVQEFVNTSPEASRLRSKQKGEDLTGHQASNVVINLLTDTIGGLINATRLLLFGAHADAFALARSAFEACCYADYFALHPDKAKLYMELEDLLSKNDGINLSTKLEKRGLQFGLIRNELERYYGQDMKEFYARLCNFGAHPSPKRVGLRLSAPKGAVSTAVSMSTPDWSRAQWTLLCASSLMAVAKYAYELPFERFPTWFTITDVSFKERWHVLSAEYQGLNQ